MPALAIMPAMATETIESRVLFNNASGTLNWNNVTANGIQDEDVYGGVALFACKWR